MALLLVLGAVPFWAMHRTANGGMGFGTLRFILVAFFIAGLIVPWAFSHLYITMVRPYLAAETGHCPGCGYNLKASTGRCPECGRPIDHPAAAATEATPPG